MKQRKGALCYNKTSNENPHLTSRRLVTVEATIPEVQPKFEFQKSCQLTSMDKLVRDFGISNSKFILIIFVTSKPRMQITYPILMF